MTTSARQILKRCPVFAMLNAAELEQIASLTEEREYEAGVTLFQEKDSVGELLVLIEGKIALQMTLPAVSGEGSRKVTIDLINPEEVVGWSAIVEPYTYNFTGICLHKARVLAINGAKLRILLRDNCHIGYEVVKGLIKVAASRLDETRQLLVSERLLSPK